MARQRLQMPVKLAIHLGSRFESIDGPVDAAAVAVTVLLGQLADNPKWKPVPKSPDYPLWTDDFSNILAVLRWW